MKRVIALGLLLSLMAPVSADEKSDAKEALKELQEFIGSWKGTGGPDKPRPTPRDPVWNENIRWAWRFKGDDAWLHMDVKDGKLFKSAELRYLPKKKLYRLTATDKEGKQLIFEGKIEREILKLERINPETKGTEQITMNTAAEGDRFIYRLAHKNEGTTLWRRDYLIAFTREGVSLGKVDKKNECVVSGGLGTIAVSYKGETYYVCCSGCADAFKENPEKYINEFKAKKAGKKEN